MPLNSTSVIKVIDLLCEGPIEGIEGGKEGIFLDETPIKTDDVENFTNEEVSYNVRHGTKSQSRLKNYQGGGTSIVKAINEEIHKSLHWRWARSIWIRSKFQITSCLSRDSDWSCHYATVFASTRSIRSRDQELYASVAVKYIKLVH